MIRSTDINLTYIFLCKFILQFIVLSWLKEKRKFSSSISLAQFDLDVNFEDNPQNTFGALGRLAAIETVNVTV